MIPYGKHYVDEDDIAAVADLMRKGWLTQGPTIAAFEDAAKAYVGAKYAVAVASGTAALHMAACAAKVGPGRALVTSPITFVASANAALYAGGEPLFADIDAQTLNMSPAALRQILATHDNVQAIIPVHFAGLPCDMVEIKALANAAGAVVIEDAAQALGATYPDGGRVGNCAHSLMTIFSFHPVKAIAAGEGGLITTNDEGVYRQLLRLRSHGINKPGDAFEAPEHAYTDGELNPWYYEMQEIGFHYRITDIQCALVKSQLKKLDRFLDRRRQLVKQYDRAFSNFKNCQPAQTSGRDLSGHHIYVLRVDFDAVGTDRGTLMRALKARGIGSQVHFIPVPMQPLYRRLGFEMANYPAAQNYYEQALTIPLYFTLTDDDQAKVIDCLTELVG